MITDFISTSSMSLLLLRKKKNENPQYKHAGLLEKCVYIVGFHSSCRHRLLLFFRPSRIIITIINVIIFFFSNIINASIHIFSPGAREERCQCMQDAFLVHVLRYIQCAGDVPFLFPYPNLTKVKITQSNLSLF